MSVVLDEKQVEKLTKLLERRDKLNAEIRALLGSNFSHTSPRARAPQAHSKPEKNNSVMEVDLDIDGVEWLTKDKQPAGPNTPWAWAFSTTKDGGLRRETLQLVQALEQYGKVRIGKYEISLGGRDGNLLNRKIA